MKAKRILPLLAAAALLAGCFKDVSYKTNYVLKPLAQAQTVDPVEPFEGLKAYAFDADTAFYTVASYEDALNGVIARKDDLRTGSPPRSPRLNPACGRGPWAGCRCRFRPRRRWSWLSTR